MLSNRRIIAAACAAVTMIASVATPIAQTAHADPVQTQAIATDYGMAASGFATQVVGGSLPVNSGRTALSVVTCTRLVPVENGNSLTTVDLGGLLTVAAATTSNRTQRVNGKEASISRTEIADVFVGPDANTSLHLEGLIVETRTWHASDGFHRKTSLNLGDISLVVGGIPVLDELIPDITDGQVIEIPGVARIAAGPVSGRTTSTSASSRRTALDIQLLGLTGDPVRVLVGQAHSRIESGFTAGAFGGLASAVSGTVAGGVLTVGPVAPRPMPCKGTNGEWRANNTADFNLAPLAVGGAATSRVSGLQNDGSAIGKAQSAVASIDFTALDLQIEGLKSNVYVRRNPNGTYAKNATFDTVTITLQGEEISIPDPGQPIEIPGVASILLNQRRTRPNGVLAIAAIITLLDDTEVFLGQSSVYIRD